MTVSFTPFATATEVDQFVPVTPGNQTQWRWVYRIQLPDIAQGDVLSVSANCEAANDTGYNIEFVDQLVIAPGWLYYDHDLGYGQGISTGSYFLSPVSGTDISPQMHYYQPDLTVHWKAPCAFTTPWLHYRIRCRSTDAVSGDVCAIKQGYGSMTGLILRGGS